MANVISPDYFPHAPSHPSILWLVDCPNLSEVTELASRVYRESLATPYIGQFVVFGRRHHAEEAHLRVLCLTDDTVDKTLECQEGFELLASSPPVEVGIFIYETF
ncbi:unnamed protein product [Protopolystoma xenopodis]|uniref:Ankyrin UPA domain-containing protein n=1 Tax=Protopolystoma xenopodis TaxID=117903 RepID=A0A3S5CM86_9PLAT|nr:unnamed protein product [Protopolystoma xenopodis]